MKSVVGKTSVFDRFILALSGFRIASGPFGFQELSDTCFCSKVLAENCQTDGQNDRKL